jgi:hypothetical protein
VEPAPGVTLLHESPDCGFARRLVRIYREKRAPVRVKEYSVNRVLPNDPGLVPVNRRMPRRAAFQISWHQANQARNRS